MGGEAQGVPAAFDFSSRWLTFWLAVELVVRFELPSHTEEAPAPHLCLPVVGYGRQRRVVVREVSPDRARKRQQACHRVGWAREGGWVYLRAGIGRRVSLLASKPSSWRILTDLNRLKSRGVVQGLFCWT